MASNRVYRTGDELSVACTAPTTPASGDPVLFGQRPGVAITDEDTDGNTTVQFGGVYNLSVKGYDGSANAAIAAGDKIYYKAGASPVLDVDTSGVFFGYAHEAVTSGATSTIMVKVATT